MVKLRAKEIRTKKRLTLREVGHRMNVGNSMICRIENGDVDPRLSTLKRLASALGVPVAKLLVDEK